ncbi:MAG: PIN domain-containing protein [Chloroflexota bacterium]
MILLDAYGLVALLAGRAAGMHVRALLREGAGVATANLVEAYEVSERRYGVPIERSAEILEPLFDQALRAIPLDRAVARRAAEMRARHYHRSKRPISLADAILLASATAGDTIVTADPDVLAIAALEGIPTIELPGEA